MNELDEICETEMLRRLKGLCDTFVKEEIIRFAGEIIQDKKALRKKVKSLLYTKQDNKLKPRYPNLDIKVWDKMYRDAEKKNK